MNKVVSIFRELLNKPTKVPQIPTDDLAPDHEEGWAALLAPDLNGQKLDTCAGFVTLKKCTPNTLIPEDSIVSPRTPLCGVNGGKLPVTAGKPYRVLATYVGHSRRKQALYFYQFQCDEGSYHLANADNCEFLGRELKAS